MRSAKPKKPRPDFPLTAHPDGLWVKKIKGKLYRFGSWSDPDGALAEYLRQKEYLQAGQEPPAKTAIKGGRNSKEPDRAAARTERQAKPSKAFTPEELRSIIGAVDFPLKAMILLGINAGFGNTDCASLPLSAVDLERGWIDIPRSKTAVGRRCPLWTETVDALRETIVNRPRKIAEGNAGLVFVTKFGNAYVRFGEKGISKDAIANEFLKNLTKLKLNGNRRTFYSLRQTFETIAGGTRDQIAVDTIMGHAPASSDRRGVKPRHIDDDRLRAVVDHVEKWLWSEEENSVTVKEAAPKRKKPAKV